MQMYFHITDLQRTPAQRKKITDKRAVVFARIDQERKKTRDIFSCERSGHSKKAINCG